MKIALVTSVFLPNTGGGEFVVHHLANQWAKQGHEVCVFNSLTNEVSHPDALYTVKQYKIIRGASRFGYHRFPWLEISTNSLNRVINEFNPDFISGHFAIPVAFYLANLKPARKWLITSHGADVIANFPDSLRDRYNVDTILGNALNKASAVISISKIAQQSIEEIGVSKSNIKYIPNGVDIEKFLTKPSTDFRKLNDIPDNAKVILTIARYANQKNLELGIRAFAEVAELYPNLYYVFAGGETKRLLPTIKAYNLQDRVIIRERLMGDELLAAYQQSNVFISTSLWEFCPLVILESFAAGIPLIATKVAGNCDLIEDGVNGLLVESNSHVEMAEALIKLLNNESLQISMRDANIAKSKLFDWAYISQLYLNEIKQLYKVY